MQQWIVRVIYDKSLTPRWMNRVLVLPSGASGAIWQRNKLVK